MLIGLLDFVVHDPAVICPKCKRIRTYKEMKDLIYHCPNGCGIYEDYANEHIRCVECNASHTRKGYADVYFCPICCIGFRIEVVARL